MSTFTEVCIAILSILGSLYYFFAVYRDLRHMRVEKYYREEWHGCARHIMSLTVEMDRMKDITKQLVDAYNKAGKFIAEFTEEKTRVPSDE